MKQIPLGGGNEVTTSDNLPESVTTKAEEADIPDDRYEGYTFRILGAALAAGQTANDIISDAETGDALGDAVYKRNRMAEERFGIKIEYVGTSGTVASAIGQAVLAGDDAYDAAAGNTAGAAGAIVNRYILQISGLPYIDIEKSWWNTGLIESSAINGEEYILMGDINYAWKNATWALCFNKRLYNEFGLEEPYKMVREGRWTIDVLEEHCRDITKDLNGDSKFDKDDQWGMLSSKTAGLGLVTSTGITTVTAGKDGTLEYILDNERNVDIIGRLRKLMTNNDIQLRAEDITGSTNIWDDIINIFREGRALYRISIMGDIVGLRDMEDDFGILPLPKYDENQESYITTYQAWNGSAYMVPASISDSKRTSAILEYMAYLSKDTITDAYYNVNLQGKVARDDDSSEMLDIIFDSMKTDVGFAFQLGSVQNVLKGIINSDTDNTASTLASSKESIVTAIKDFEESAKG